MNKEILNTIQLLTNISASLAATVAIGLFIKDFFKNRRKPLKVIKTVAYRGPDDTTRFYFVVKNRRDYAVKIKKISCYTEDLYILRKYPDHPPSYYKTFSSTKKVFENTVDLTIAPSGEENLIITISGHISNVNALCLNMWTDYGYYEQKIKNVVVYDSGKMEVTDVDSWEDCKNQLEARFKYYKEYAKYWFGKMKQFVKSK